MTGVGLPCGTVRGLGAGLASRLGVSGALLGLAALLAVASEGAGHHVAFLLLLGAAFTLWLSDDIPRGPTAIALLVAADVLGLTGDESAFAGFGGESFFFIAGVLTVASALRETGTLTRVSERFLRRWTPLTPLDLLWRVPLLLFASASVISSATARVSLLAPVSRSLLDGRRGRGGLETYLTAYVGHASPVASRAFLSGGPGVIVAADLMARQGYRLGWLEWTVWMGVPVIAVLALSALLHWLWLRPEAIEEGEEGEGPPLNAKDGANLAVMAGMVCAWILGPVIGVSPAATAVLGALAAGTIHGAVVFRAVDWDLVVFSGGALSFGYVLVNAGTAGWLGSSLFPLLDRMGGSGLLPLAAFGVFVLLRLTLSTGVSYSAVVFPILLGMEPLEGLEPLSLALVALLAGAIVLLPAQSMPAMISYASGRYGMRRALLSAVLVLACTAVVIQFLAVPYWSWLATNLG